MKTGEKNLWRWLRDGCRGFFPRGQLVMVRVENYIGEGDPDTDCVLHSDAFKIELKTAKRPTRVETEVSVSFRPSQVPWLERWCEAGGRAYVLVQVGSGHSASRYLIRGRDAAEVERGATERRLSELSVTRFDATAPEIVSAAAIGAH